MVIKPIVIIKRNLNLMVNSKLSSIVIFLGPIILMIAIGIALQGTELRTIHAGIYSEDWSELKGDKFVSGFEEKIGDFKEESSLEECKTNVINSKYDACIEIKKDAEYQLIQEEKESSINTPSYEIISYVDLSKTRMVWSIINRIQRITELQSQEMLREDVLRIVGEIDSLIDKVKSQREQMVILKSKLDSKTSSLNELNNKITQAKIYVQSIGEQVDNIKKIAQGDVINLLGGIYFDLDGLNKLFPQIESLSSLSTSGTDSSRVDVIIYTIDETIAKWDSLKETDLSQISGRVNYQYNSVLDDSPSYKGKSFDQIDYLFPSFMMFFIIFVSLVFPATMIIRERISKSYIRNVISKTSSINFAFFNFVSCILIISIQILIMILLSNFFLNVNIFSNIISTSILILLSIGIISLLGILIGYLFSSHETAIIASISIALIMLIFLPGITPLEILPPPISNIVRVLPSSIFEDKIRRSILAGGGSFSFSGIEILSLVISIVIVIGGIIILHIKNRRKEI